MRWLAASLALVLAFPAAPLPAQDAAVSLLNIVVIEGEGAINNIRQRTAREPIVQVEDQNRKPVAGAAVTFTLPSRGASGAFPNGSRTVTVLTDSQGRAQARGLRPNSVQGRMEIRVTASATGGVVASTIITQTNVIGAAVAGAAAAGISTKLLITVAAIAGAAVAGGVVAATSGGNGSSGTGGTGSSATTITPGTGTVGPPR
jgi:hypothetical protein